MKLRKISTIVLFLPFLYCLGEFFILNKPFSVKARDFRKFFNEKSPTVNKVKSFAYRYYSIVSPNKISSICPGVDNYIFYCPVSDGNPLRDLFYDFQIKPFESVNDQLLNEFKGHQNFHYLDIPSKFRIFSDKWILGRDVIPQYVIADQADKLYSREIGDKYYSIRETEEILKKYKSEYIYYFRDTHWTFLGALKVIETLNLPFAKSIDLETFGTHGGDLVTMGNTLAGASFEIVDKSISIKNSSVSVEVSSDHKIRNFKNKENSQGPRVLIVGDSFRESFSPIISEWASEVDEFHLSIYLEQKIDSKKYDYIFVLRTERYIPNGIL